MNQLDLFAAYKPAASARTTDPETSRQAAVAQIGRKADNQRRVLQALYEAGANGLNDFELSDRVGLLQTSAGVRRGELRNRGLVRRAVGDDGKPVSRPSTTTGSPSAVWVLTAAGCLAAEMA